MRLAALPGHDARAVIAQPMTPPYRHPDRTDRDPDVVAAGGADGGDGEDSRLSARGDDVRDRRAGRVRELVRAAGGAFARCKQPLVAWMVGVGGLFGYHALYFLALRFAPPAEAGLLNYLWPLLIVLFSSLLPGERLAPHHIIGALLGLAGTVLLFAGNRRRSSRPARCRAWSRPSSPPSCGRPIR